MTTIHIVWTMVAFLVFVGIVIWAYSSKQKQRFNEAARLPLDDDDPTDSKG
jgi:cytochrome c oxidase cbb3-type subunit 4